MKALFSLIIIAISSTVLAQHPNDITGLWLVQSEDAYIRIYEIENKFFGKIAWLEEPYGKDGETKTDADGTPLLEMEIMQNFKFDDGEWVDGTVYDAENGKTYYGSIEMENSNTLNLRGSLDSFGLLGRTETWTRLDEK